MNKDTENLQRVSQYWTDVDLADVVLNPRLIPTLADRLLVPTTRAATRKARTDADGFRVERVPCILECCPQAMRTRERGSEPLIPERVRFFHNVPVVSDGPQRPKLLASTLWR